MPSGGPPPKKKEEKAFDASSKTEKKDFDDLGTSKQSKKAARSGNRFGGLGAALRGREPLVLVRHDEHVGRLGRQSSAMRRHFCFKSARGGRVHGELAGRASVYLALAGGAGGGDCHCERRTARRICWPTRGRSTTRGGSDLDWRRRPGRFAEADASMRLAFTAAVPVAPPAAEDDARPFRRVAFEIPLREVALYREILDEVHARNAAALGLDPTLDPEETRFELRRRRLSAAEAADATLGVLTGFHVIDGDARRLAVEGTEEALEGIVRVAVRVRSESHRERARAKKDPTDAVAAQIKYSPRVSYNGDLSYRARLYRAFGADLWPMKLSRSIESLTRDAATLSGDRVRGEVRDAIRALDALGRFAWAREAEHAAAGAGWPRVEDLIALDRRFGAELTAVDVSGEAPYERGSWKAATSEMRAIGAVRSRREAAEAEAAAAAEARRLRETTLSTRTTGRRTFKDELNSDFRV